LWCFVVDDGVFIHKIVKVVTKMVNSLLYFFGSLQYGFIKKRFKLYIKKTF